MHLPLQPYGWFVAALMSTGFMGLYTLVVWAGLKHLKVGLNRGENLALSLVIGILASSWITFGTWYVAGQAWGTMISWLIPLWIIVWQRAAILRLTVDAWKALKRVLRHPQRLWLLRAGFWAILTLIAAWMCYTHFLQPSPDGWRSAGNTWADLALHMSLASHFVVQGVHNLMLPVFPAAKLTYPFLVDLQAAQLYQTGHSWQVAFGYTSWLLIMSSCYLLYRIATRITGRKLAGIIWVVLILLAGTAAGVIPLWRDLLSGSLEATKDYSHLSVGAAASQEHFANLVTSHLLPQRSYLMGLAVASSCVLLLQSFFEILKNTKLQHWLVLGIIIGLLPLAHVHSAFVAAGLLGGAAIWLSIKKQPQARLAWLGVLIAGVIALPQLIWQFGGSFHGGFSYWHLGWMTPEGGSTLVFWWINWGLLLVFIPLAIWRASRRQWSPILWLLILEAVLIMIACNLYIFQPNPWDNMKFITYGYIWLTLPVAWLLADFTRHGWPEKILVGVTLLIITTPGMQSVWLEGTQNYVFLSNGDLKLADYVSQNTAPITTILTSDRHNHPVSTLTGRTIIMGYRGWLSSYGINYASTENDLDAIWLQEETTANLIKKYQVQYIVLDDTEATEKGVDIERLNQTYSEIYYQDGWHIWAVDQVVGQR